MNYRLAEENDIDSICELIASAIAEMECNNIHQWDVIYPTREDFLSDIIKKTLYVGTIDDEIAVVYAINKETDEQYANGAWEYPDSDYSIIHRLCVNPKYQNRGVARETLNHIETTLKAAGTESIRLDVFTENPFALKLYRRNGYTEVGSAHWRKGTFLLMEKHL
ncbi:MAG: GNAT family N-acetyltransferase [Lachnospiraceae bacterium]|nr:GNAT family N-acetyltransferase [Lachnospiraceae bacterium]